MGHFCKFHMLFLQVSFNKPLVLCMRHVACCVGGSAYDTFSSNVTLSVHSPTTSTIPMYPCIWPKLGYFRKFHMLFLQVSFNKPLVLCMRHVACCVGGSAYDTFSSNVTLPVHSPTTSTIPMYPCMWPKLGYFCKFHMLFLQVSFKKPLVLCMGHVACCSGRGLNDTFSSNVTLPVHSPTTSTIPISTQVVLSDPEK